MTTLYGIKNCDTVKKAKSWLESRDIEFVFHDFRANGLSETQVAGWISDLGLDTLINRRSTTWKALDESTKNSLDESSAVAIILANPTLIKRPLLDINGTRQVGFKADQYSTLFNKD